MKYPVSFPLKKVWSRFPTLKVEVLFICFDSLRPINNLSVKQGQVFLG